MKLHERLKEIRTERNLTLKDLSQISELSVSYLSDIERGRTMPSIGALQNISMAFGISVIDFLAGVDFAGEKTTALYPSGLQELLNDKEFKAELTGEWIDVLSRIELRGKRPQTKREWLELYLHLKRILED